jgi:Domain of unknown function (DUF1906)
LNPQKDALTGHVPGEINLGIEHLLPRRDLSGEFMHFCVAGPSAVRSILQAVLKQVPTKRRAVERAPAISAVHCFGMFGLRRTWPGSYSLLLATLLLFYSSTAFGQASIGRINQNNGWVLSGRLFWTSDQGAHWKDISPSSNMQFPVIRSVHFFDASHATVLTSSWDHAAHTRRFEVSSTSDEGANWSTVPLALEAVTGSSISLTGTGNIYFLDALHGWLNLNVNSSANFARGLLLMTVDGGKTWNPAPGSPGIAGDVRFTTLGDGWIAGGPGGQKLFVTHDGAHTWQPVTVPVPSELFSSTGLTFDLPVFDSSSHGFLAVTVARQKGLGSALTLYETKDGGKSWVRNRVHSDVGRSTSVPNTVVNANLITGMMSGKTSIKLANVQEGDNIRMVKGAIPSTPSGLADGQLGEPSFVDSTNGWIREGDRIFSTSNGGTSWSEITPKNLVQGASKTSADTARTASAAFSLRPHRYSEQQAPGKPESSAPKVAANEKVVANDAPGGPVSTGLPTNGRLGFDLCAAPTTDVMQSWWNLSPYYTAGIYIGGDNRSCGLGNLDATWVTVVTGQGWGLMPIWAGSQPSCACPVGSTTCTQFDDTISTDLPTATSQGAKDARKALLAASSLGLSGIIYLDMSSYDVASCGASVSAFTNSWVSGVRTGGFLAGMYGSPADTASISSLDAVWVADPNGEASILGLSPLPDSSYPLGQRAHQYVQGEKTAWGDATLKNVDTNLVAAPVVAGNASQVKPFEFSYLTIDYPGASGTAITGINNVHNSTSLSQAQVGTVVGYYTDATTGLQGSFTYDGTNYTPISVPGAVSTTAYGINDQGTVVGTYLLPVPDQGGSVSTGFIYSGGVYTTIIPPDRELLDISRYIDISGVNDNGVVVGEYSTPGAPGIQGFSYDTNTSTFTNLNSPGAMWSIAWGINGFNQVMGWADEPSSGPVPWVLDTGQYTALSSPPFYPASYGLNNNGQAIGGGFFAGSNFFSNLGYPEGNFSTVSGLNDSSELVGNYTGSDAVTHGFIAVPNGEGTGNETAPPTPIIKFNGKNVTDKTVNVTVGQQIALMGVIPAAERAKSGMEAWSQPSGTAVGNVNIVLNGGVSIQVVPPTTGTKNEMGSSYTYYWLYPSKKDHPYVMTYQYSVDGILSSPATVTFNVSGIDKPEIVSALHRNAFISQLTNCDGNPKKTARLAFGPISGSCRAVSPPYGITFTQAGTAPSAGTFQWVQVLTADTVAFAGANQYVCTTPGLDRDYPYHAVLAGNVAVDSPNGPLPDNYGPVTRTFAATMFLMWEPTPVNKDTPSIFVPVAYQQWTFDPTANETNPMAPKQWDRWTAGGGGDVVTPKSIPSAPDQINQAAGIGPYGYPLWAVPAVQKQQGQPCQ